MTLKDLINSFRVKYALKAVIGSIICVIINAYFHLPYGLFSVMTVFVLTTKYNHYPTLEKGLHLFIITTIGLLLALIFVSLFSAITPIYLISMALLLLVLMYLSVEIRFGFSALWSGLSFSFLMVRGIGSPELVSSIAFSMIFQTALGIIVTLVINHVIWPPRTHLILNKTLSATFTDFEKLFCVLINKFIEPSPSKFPSSNLSLDTFSHLLDLISLSSKEQKKDGFPEDLYMKLIAHCKHVFIKIEVLEQTLNKGQLFLLEKDIAHTIKEIIDRLSVNFKNLSESIVKKSLVKPEEEIHQAIAYLENQYIIMHDRQGMDDQYYRDVVVLGSLPPIFRDIVSEMDKIIKAYNIIQSERAYDIFTKRKLTRTPSVEEQREHIGFQTNIDSLKRSAKVVIAALLVVLGELHFIFPDPGGETIFTAIIIAAPANLGQAYLKERLRFIAIVVGGLYSLLVILIVSKLQHFFIFLPLLSLGLFLGSYIATGSARIAYAGYQMGIVLPLILLSSSGPPVSFTNAINRFVGVVVGGAIALLVLYFIWPVDPLEQLKAKLSMAIRRCGVIFRTLLKLNENDEEKIKSMVISLASTLPTSGSLLNDAHYVLRNKELNDQEFIEIIESLELIYVEFETLNKTIYADVDNTLINKYLSFMATYYEKIGSSFNVIAEQFHIGENIATQAIDISILMEQIKERRFEFRQTGVSLQFGKKDLERFSVIISSIDSILSSLNKISVAINRINGIKVYPSQVEVTRT